MQCMRFRWDVKVKDRAKSQSRQQSWEDLSLSVQVSYSVKNRGCSLFNNDVIYFCPDMRPVLPNPITPLTPHIIHWQINFFPDRTESENSLYLSYDCEGDQDRTEVRQSSYTCAGPAPATTTTPPTTTTTAVDSAVSFVEVSTDCPHDPGSSCYLQSKTGMDWHQAGKVERFYFTSTFI